MPADNASPSQIPSVVMPTPLTPSQDRRRYGLIFVAVCLAYLCTVSDAYLTLFSDGRDMLWTAVSLHELGELAIPLPEYPAPDQRGETERHSKYGLGYPILQQLPLLLARPNAILFGKGHGNLLLVSTNMFLTAASATLIALCLRLLGFAFRVGLLAALAFAFGTFAWPYISYDFSEPLQVFCLIASYWLLLKATTRRFPSALLLLSSGFILGFGVFTKAFLLVAIPSFGLYLWMSLQVPFQRKAKSLLWFFLPFLVWSVVIALLNVHRFGSVFDFGYGGEAGQFDTPLATGLYGLLLSPNKGIIFYAPVSILALWSLAKTWSEQRPWSIFLVTLVLVYVVPTSMWWSWEGGTSWGPRLVLPVLPFLVMSAAMLIARVNLAAAFFTACVIIGFLINVLGVLVPMSTWNYVLELNDGMRVPLDVRGRPPAEYVEHDGQKWFLPSVASSYLPNLSAISGHAWLLRLRYFDRPFALERLKNSALAPPDPLDFPPLKVDFGRLRGESLDYALWQLESAHFWLWDSLSGRRANHPPESVHGIALHMQGYRAIAQGDFARALLCFTRALELMPNSAATAISLSQVAFRLGDPQKAESTLIQFLHRNPAEPLARLRLGQFYEATGKPKDALDAYSTFQSLHPNDENLGHIQQRIKALTLGKNN